MLERWRLRGECKRFIHDCYFILDSLRSLLEDIKPLGDRELGYIVLHIQTLRNKLSAIEQKVESEGNLDSLKALRDELRELHHEILGLRDQLHYLAKLVPSEMLKLSMSNMTEYCAFGKDVLGIIGGAEKVFTILLRGFCKDLQLRILEDFERVFRHLERVASVNVHPCVEDAWRDFLCKDIEELEKVRRKLDEKLPESLKELCIRFLELQEIAHFIENEAPSRLSRYEEFRDQYLSPERMVKLIPKEALKLFSTPEEIYEMFSADFRQEVQNLTYILGREKEVESLLRRISYCLYQLKEKGGG